MPRLSGENFRRNQGIVETVARLARHKNVTPAQLCIAWVLAKHESVVPVIGARTQVQLADALGALHAPLSQEELAVIEQAVSPDAVAGSRYGDSQMQILDSER